MASLVTWLINGWGPGRGPEAATGCVCVFQGHTFHQISVSINARTSIYSAFFMFFSLALLARCWPFLAWKPGSRVPSRVQGARFLVYSNTPPSRLQGAPKTPGTLSSIFTHTFVGPRFSYACSLFKADLFRLQHSDPAENLAQDWKMLLGVWRGLEGSKGLFSPTI